MKKIEVIVFAVVLIVSVAPGMSKAISAEAVDAFALENFGGSVAIATEYVFRGISQTSEDPAVQGSFDYGHPSGFYLGIWGSNVDEGISAGNIELDYYAGFTREFFERFSFDIGVIYYHYPSGGSDPELDFIEGYLGLCYTFSGLPLQPAIGLKYYFSPDFFGEDGDGHYINGTLSFSLPLGLLLAFEAGYQDVEGDETTGSGQGEDGDDGYDYANWRIGLSKEVKGFKLELSYHDTNEEKFLGEDIADDRIVFILSRSF